MSTATTGTRKRAAAFFFGAGSALNLANAAGSVNSATLDTPQGHTIRCLGAHPPVSRFTSGRARGR